MGEAADYEALQEELNAAMASHEQSEREAVEAAAMEKERAYAEGPQNYFQTGCPFKLKDIVLISTDASLDKEGKVIGLPTREDELARNEKFGKAWIHFDDGKWEWHHWIRPEGDPPASCSCSGACAPRGRVLIAWSCVRVRCSHRASRDRRASVPPPAVRYMSRNFRVSSADTKRDERKKSQENFERFGWD